VFFSVIISKPTNNYKGHGGDQFQLNLVTNL